MSWFNWFKKSTPKLLPDLELLNAATQNYKLQMAQASDMEQVFVCVDGVVDMWRAELIRIAGLPRESNLKGYPADGS